MYKRWLVGIFCTILFLPTLFSILSFFTGKTFDVSLNGYTTSTAKPQLSIASFLSGDYQTNYSLWYQENFKPRGVFIKNYSTILYNLFHTNNTRIIGYNNDIFEQSYINAELCIGGCSDFSEPEPQTEAQLYMEKLQILQDKLAQYGKTLYVVLTPSKADFHREYIPKKYIDMGQSTAVSGEDYLAELLNQSDIPHIICSEKKDELDYPAFYMSGIHWSKTFEQETLVNILQDLATETGKTYPMIELGNVAVQEYPFNGDADVFDLMNVWNPYTETYYQYEMETIYPTNYDPLRVLFHGTSFSSGLFGICSEVFPFEETLYINRNSFMQTSSNVGYYQPYAEINLNTVLDKIDAVVIEILPPELEQYGYGFIDLLLTALDTYTPTPPQYMSCLDINDPNEWILDNLKGFNEREMYHVWTKQNSQITIRDSLIEDDGLQLDLTIPDQFFKIKDSANLKIYVNGTLTKDLNYSEPWSGSIVINSSEFPHSEDSIYTIQLICDTYFVPAQLQESADSRELAISLTYVGRSR